MKSIGAAIIVLAGATILAADRGPAPLGAVVGAIGMIVWIASYFSNEDKK